MAFHSFFDAKRYLVSNLVLNLMNWVLKGHNFLKGEKNLPVLFTQAAVLCRRFNNCKLKRLNMKTLKRFLHVNQEYITSIVKTFACISFFKKWHLARKLSYFLFRRFQVGRGIETRDMMSRFLFPAHLILVFVPKWYDQWKATREQGFAQLVESLVWKCAFVSPYVLLDWKVKSYSVCFIASSIHGMIGFISPFCIYCFLCFVWCLFIGGLGGGSPNYPRNPLNELGNYPGSYPGIGSGSISGSGWYTGQGGSGSIRPGYTLTNSTYSRDHGFICPAQFRVPKGLDYVVRVGGKVYPDCGAPCHGMFFSEPEVRFSRLWVAVWGAVCMASCLFTVRNPTSLFSTYVIIQECHIPRKPFVPYFFITKVLSLLVVSHVMLLGVNLMRIFFYGFSSRPGIDLPAGRATVPLSGAARGFPIGLLLHGVARLCHRLRHGWFGLVQPPFRPTTRLFGHQGRHGAYHHTGHKARSVHYPLYAALLLWNGRKSLVGRLDVDLVPGRRSQVGSRAHWGEIALLSPRHLGPTCRFNDRHPGYGQSRRCVANLQKLCSSSSFISLYLS